jgi:hypothetical protein
MDERSKSRRSLEQLNLRCFRQGDGVGGLRIKGDDLLGLVFLEDCEVLSLEVLDQVAAAVARGHIDHHQFSPRSNRKTGVVGGSGRLSRLARASLSYHGRGHRGAEK